MATIIIDGQELQIGDDERLNLVQAAERVGVKIPYYCWHPGLSVVASCRMCLVEVGQKLPTGQIQMQPRLVPACQTPARDGTVMITNSEAVLENRRAVEEYLLLEHPIDCPICDQAGECALQDYYYQHGRRERRDLPQPFSSRRKDLGPEVTLFIDRCVMCSRCVRFTREITGTAELHVVQRGNHAEIDVFPGYPIDNKLSGNVVDICPVGALCSRDFLYQQRVWFLKSHPSICVGCATGCSLNIDENKGQIYRLKPRHNPQANGWWLCDEGRLSYKHVAAESRLITPRRRVGSVLQDAEWSTLLPALREDLVQSVRRHGGYATVAVLSPMLPVEEAFLLAKYLKSLSPNVCLALGRVPVVGADEAYPKLPTGQVTASPKFVIHAEKCPNRVGVEALLQALDYPVVTFDAVLDEIANGTVKTLFLTGGYLAPWLSDEELDRLSRVELLVLADILASPLCDQVHYLLPGAAWAEKAGSYVNQAGLLQRTERGLRPPGDAHAEGRIFWELAERSRLYLAEDVLRELARDVPYFAACEQGPVPEQGMRLGGLGP
ncbi:MAG: molybdopterin-dependent oxidoreductase [Planctomycetota bacterium]|nr:molybdopterin-dependent oxidoreductase [Planctomycetota bacterium]